jgi:hypothetical protein
MHILLDYVLWASEIAAMQYARFDFAKLLAFSLLLSTDYACNRAGGQAFSPQYEV